MAVSTQGLRMKSPIEVASSVTLHLSLTLEDGTVSESTFGEEPLTFTMGDGTLVHGLELGLYGLVPGDVQRLVDTGIELEEGVIVGFETPEGEELAGAILSIDEDTVNVDFNHPMAGHTIIFDVEIIDVVPADGGGDD